MIELRGIYAGYRGQEVLRDLNLRLETQRITAVVGPNGSGKSTLLRVAARLLAPAAGTVLLAGQPVERYGRKEFARRVAVLPQARNTPALTAEALVLHGRFPYLGYPRRYSKADCAAADAAMVTVSRSRARTPNTYTAATTEGVRAIRTSSMMAEVVRPRRIWGADWLRVGFKSVTPLGKGLPPPGGAGYCGTG